MPFSKGDRNINRKGRPTLGNDISSVQMRNKVRGLLDDNFEKLQTELGATSGKSFVNAYISLLPYSLPKYANKEPKFDITSLDEDSINALFDLMQDKLFNRKVNE